MTSHISGWDIGGAHIKVARCDQNGVLKTIIQVPCPLWKGIDQLEIAIQSVFLQLNNQDDITAITMTGELVDIFPNRQAGVIRIIECLSHYIHQDKLHIYGAQLAWIRSIHAGKHWQYIASRNWQASASLTAQHQVQGIFVDIGSTTCDIIAFANGKAMPNKVDDIGRQTSRELLYTGTIRTPLIALSQSAPFNGELISLAAEVFASTGDVWCLLGKLSPDTIQDLSSDELPWDNASCARRIARLLGTDSTLAPLKQWQQLAQWFAQQQCQQINAAILQVLSAHPTLALDAPIIGAGVGRFIIQQCAQSLNRPYLDFHHAIDNTQALASDHAPAVSIALLAQQDLS